ncbi:Sel1 domain-containing protein [Campylobacter blaseri]|uniref:beta-lactamase n=1 Tax=Campylobacter blaseri TaxID=2042961 RepID=A0A2P8R418_9BACT|nr:tetratricopeptide repeat protein [Campylobacter blaseri]PSM53213.1 hypothetical protein CQ405_01300 [Campylobacter blaseri]PSM54679.1 hypothetical protein CRN67_01300 [Campylobacter blaseri]QKF86844.1 Sel1 domain-containing protein [Campylobacter blaseri]
MKKIILLTTIFISICFGDLISQSHELYKKGDYKNAIKNLQKVCEKGVVEGCHNLSLIYLDKKINNSTKAKEYLQKACNANLNISCLSLGELYEVGVGSKKDPFKAFELYEKSCKLKSVDGCFKLGYFYEKGLATRQNFDKAEEIYKKNCDKKDIKSCLALGGMYEKGVKKNLEKSNQYFKKACENGGVEGCLKMVVFSLNTTPPNAKNIIFYLDKACNLGNDSSCMDIGVYYTKGELVEQNLSKAKEYFGLACDMKNLKGCESYRVLNEEGF